MNNKYALCIGINDYPGTGLDLAGCVNDAIDFRDFLEDRDYDVEVLLDSDATKDEIMDGITSLVGILGYRDTLVITYSGHGSWVPDTDGDEVDGRDEVLVPHDFGDGNLIKDDELYEVLRRRAWGSRTIFFSDSCHSGTMQRFGGLPAGGTANIYAARYMPPAVFLDPDEVAAANVALVQGRTAQKFRKTSGILMSGCAEWEYSYDAWFNNRANGAFTYYALSQYRDGMSMIQWHDAIRERLPIPKYPQTPELQGGWWHKRWRI